MNKNQRLLFWMLLVLGGLCILIPQLIIWSQVQSISVSVFRVVDADQERNLERLRLSVLPLKYSGVLFLGGAAGLLAGPFLKEE